MSTRARRATGWLAVGVATPARCFRACWGVLESFHEGWHRATLAADLALTLGQSLAPLAVFLGAALAGLRWPRVGGVGVSSATDAAAIVAVGALGWFPCGGAAFTRP